MNQDRVKEILSKVKAGENVAYNDLRSVTKAVGIKMSAKKNDLLANLQAHVSPKQSKAVVAKRGRGRPKADPNNIVGYKVKIGLRYPTSDGTLTTSMKEAQTFNSVEDGQAAVDKLLAKGEVRLWKGSVRAKFLPRYGKSE
jgi:hypothetical protein